MALTAYSLCPGGTGKKLKFCCPGSLEELEKIYKFMEAEQFSACLNYIDSLLNKDASRECLLALRCRVLEQMPEKRDELVSTAKSFFQQHPDNPVALAEAVRADMIDMHDKFVLKNELRKKENRFTAEDYDEEMEKQRENLKKWVSMMESAANSDTVMMQIADKFPLLARVLISADMYESAFEWIRFLLPSQHYRQEAQQLLGEILSNLEIPLSRRVMLAAKPVPDDKPWSKTFNDLAKLMASFRWTSAMAGLRELADTSPDVLQCPTYWYNLAVLHEWKCDLPEARQCWEKYLETDITFDQRLEIQTRLFALNRFPLDDAVNVFQVSFPLTETDAVKDALLADPCVRMLAQDLPPLEDGSVALGAYSLLDGEKFRSPAELDAADFSVEDMPVIIGNIFLWARQTDKAPRLTVGGVLNSTAVLEHLRETLGKWIDGEPGVTVVGQDSATTDSLSRGVDFPMGIDSEKERKIQGEYYRDLLLNRWVHFPLGVLDRQSMLKAAADPAYRLRVEAVLEMLKPLLVHIGLRETVFADLREKLSLPALPEIAPELAAYTHPLFFDRVDVTKIPVGDLSRFFQNCSMYGKVTKSIETARYIIATEGMPDALWSQAAVTLMQMRDPQTDLHKLAEQSRELCQRNSENHVPIDIMEMELYMEEGNQAQFMRIVNHLQEEHPDDPQVVKAMLYLQQMARASMAERVGGMPPAAGAAPDADSSEMPKKQGSGLWTPSGSAGGGKPGDSAGGASKLWVPD